MSPYDADDEPDRRPVKRKPRRPRCSQRGCRRDVEPDGYGELIHSDTFMYQCEPGDPRNRMATAR